MTKNKETYFNEQELNNILDVRGVHNNRKIHLTNEIFTDLMGCNEFKSKTSKVKNKNGEINTYQKEANANHLAFAFSYVYLISYLYRYTHYSFTNSSGEEFINERLLYQLCNTSPDSRGINGVSYITKNKGILYQLGYTEKTLDIPINYYYIDDFGYSLGKDIRETRPSDIEFSFYKDVDFPDNHPLPNFKINYPKKAFFLDQISEQAGIKNGYYFHPENTTQIDVKIFTFCMSRKDLSTIGFYLYCFLKSKVDFFDNSFNRSINDLMKDTGIGKTKLIETLKTLEEYNMISNSHNYFVLNLPQDKALPANSYYTKDYMDFMKCGKKTVTTRKVMPFELYDKEIGEYLFVCDELIDSNDVNIELPFNM